MNDQQVVVIYERIAAIWPAFQVREAMDAEWRPALKRFQFDDAMFALDEMKHMLKWPPSLADFYEEIVPESGFYNFDVALPTGKIVASVTHSLNE